MSAGSAPAPLAHRDPQPPRAVVEARYAALPLAIRDRLSLLEDRAEARHAESRASGDRLARAREDEGIERRNIGIAEMSTIPEREVSGVAMDPTTGAP